MSYAKEGKLSFWLGNPVYPSREGFLKDWIEEQYTANDPDGVALSQFMKVYQTGWYDHDFQDVHFVEKACPLEELIQNCSFQESYKEAVLSAAKEKGLTLCNAIIILFDFEYPESKGKELNSLPLKFLGSFFYKASHSPWMDEILNMKYTPKEEA